MAQAAIPIAVAVAAAVVSAGATAILTPKPSVGRPLAVPDRNSAASAAMNDREFRRRQGAAANILTGPSGAEAPSPGAKSLLGQ